MIVEIIAAGTVGVIFGSFMEKKFIEYRLWSFDRTLKNSILSITKVLEDIHQPESDKMKRVKNHLQYLNSEFRKTKNLE